MKPPSRWTPVSRFPLSKTLNTCFPKSAKKKAGQKSEIVSERLCDDILQRLSPFLRRKPPVDIIDLWPGAGLWSSKIHDFLKPRRHVLIEPDLDTFGPFLKPLVETKANYELLSMDIQAYDDWHGLMSKHLPEQGPSCCDTSGPLAKNDTLLVLANPPPNNSKRNHYTPARWWSVFLDTCLRQAGLNCYGSVRVIATLPVAECQSIMPRSVIDRKRPALLTESVALHAFEAACPVDAGTWTIFKGWDVMLENAARVSERTAASKLEIPPGREPRDYPLAPESPEPGQKPTPYVPRIKSDTQERLMGVINEMSGSTDKTDKQKRTRAIIQLNQENRYSWVRLQLREKKIRLDELIKSLSRVAADPNSNAESLKSHTDSIAALSSDIAEESANLRHHIIHYVSGLIDDHRTAFHTGSFDDALLSWDRRPFEPLLIDPEELYPREFDRSMIYFEADANSSVIQRVQDVEPSKRSDFFRVFESLTLIFSNRASMSAEELVSLMFPDRPINNIVRSIPSLATFAGKKLKPDFDSHPKTVHPGSYQNDNDPVACFQENIDYDLSDVRIRCLAATTLWDISLEYLKSGANVSPVQLSRLLGGTLTSFRTGDYAASQKRLH